MSAQELKKITSVPSSGLPNEFFQCISAYGNFRFFVFAYGNKVP